MKRERINESYNPDAPDIVVLRDAYFRLRYRTQPLSEAEMRYYEKRKHVDNEKPKDEGQATTIRSSEFAA